MPADIAATPTARGARGADGGDNEIVLQVASQRPRLGALGVPTGKRTPCTAAKSRNTDRKVGDAHGQDC